MSYYAVLKDIIEKSGLTNKEISEKCEKSGHKVDPSYISKLVNMKLSPASEKINTSIAEACNANPDRLILEAYLDKAPEKLIEFINSVKSKYNYTFSDDVNQLNLNIDNQPLSEFVIGFHASNLNSTSETKGIVMPDASMEPVINKGDRLIVTNFAENPEPVEFLEIENSNFEKSYKEKYVDNIGFYKHVKHGDIIALWDFKESKLAIGYYRAGKFLIKETGDELGTFEIITANWENANYEYIYDFTDILFDIVDISEDANSAIIKRFYFNEDAENSPVICVLGKVSQIIKSI